MNTNFQAGSPNIIAPPKRVSIAALVTGSLDVQVGLIGALSQVNFLWSFYRTYDFPGREAYFGWVGLLSALALTAAGILLACQMFRRAIVALLVASVCGATCWAAAYAVLSSNPNEWLLRIAYPFFVWASAWCVWVGLQLATAVAVASWPPKTTALE